MHESTVCRAVADKHACLLNGALCALDEFFAAARPAQEMLRELIAQEEHPLSDSQLVERLAERGYPIARRTVAKYREQLGIPLHRLHKKLSGSPAASCYRYPPAGSFPGNQAPLERPDGDLHP
jgi:DNA-directed RNA polymerase specialized sigma54-like protein